MNLFADSNVEVGMISALRAAGHDVLSASDLGPDPGDSELMAIALNESRVVLTKDLDFGEMTVKDHEFNYGVILLRLSPLSLKERIKRVEDVLKVISQPPPGVILVIEPGKTRTRNTSE